MGRPKEHDAETGQALLDAAEALLAEAGPGAISVRAVADAVGSTTRAVYSLFGSKAGLLEGLAVRGYELLTGYVSGLPTTDDAAADLVEVGLHGFRRFALERPHLFRLTFERVAATTTGTPAAATAGRASYEALAARIRAAQRAGAISDRPEVEVAFVFHVLCQGLASGELSREPPPVGASFWRHAQDIDGEHLWRTGLEALVAGLAPPPTPRRRRRP